MQRTQSITNVMVNAMAALMLPEEPGARPDIVSGLKASETIAQWATAVWGSKPAREIGKLPGLADPWDPSIVRAGSARSNRPWTSSFHTVTATRLPESIMSALYGDNRERRNRCAAG